MSRVELLEMLAKTTDKLDRSGEDSQQQKRSEEEKRQLQEYIAKKRAERMREFRLKRDALREREVRPFQTTADSSKMVQDLNVLIIYQICMYVCNQIISRFFKIMSDNTRKTMNFLFAVNKRP